MGYLKEHGRAPYQNRPGKDPSYFVRVLSERGKVRTFWGNDLERALRESESQPKYNEKVGIRRTAREPITRRETQRDASGQVSEVIRTGYRARWEVEKVQVFVERSRRARQVRDAHTDVRAAVRAHPELKSTFLSIRSAEELAAKRFPDPQEREKFLSLVREAIAGSIQRGEPLPEMRMKDRGAEQRPPVTRPTKPREDPSR